MPNIPLSLPAGVVKPGTEYGAKGRWLSSNLIRWHDGDVMQPMGGWAALSGCTSTTVGGPVRGMLAYRRNTGQARLIFGTPTKLFDYHDGVLTDVTIDGFTTGDVQASGDYYDRVEANTWQIAMFGEDPIACAYSDGRLLRFDASLGGDVTAVTNAPVDNVGVVVTPERFVVALGAGGDRRLVAWADQETLTVWTPTTHNQAGDFPLTTRGQIMAGRPGKHETLIWTDHDLWTMRYIGGDLIYAFDMAGSACGVVSRRAMVVHDGRAVWMGRRGFFVYDGMVKPIECPVGDYVFNRLNEEQASQIAANIRVDFHEIWWHYPTGASDNDEAVVWNYMTDHWRVEPIDRTAGIDRGPLEYPLASDPNGAIYEHEQGSTYVDEGDSPSYTPYAESGPIELGNGDTMMDITQFIPDEETLGEARIKIYSRLYPTGTETDEGYVTLANPTDLRITARQVRLRVEQVSAGFRWGTPKLEATPGSLR